MRGISKAAGLCFGSAFLIVTVASADTLTSWIGPSGSGGDGSWSAPSNWSSGTSPNGSNYAATISNGSAETVTLDVNATVDTLALGNSATLSLAANRGLTANSITNNSGALLLLLGTNSVVNMNTLSNSGAITVAGGNTTANLPTINLTGGGLGITDVNVTSNDQVGGNFNVVNGPVITSAFSNLSSIEGTLTFYNLQITSITPAASNLNIASTGTLGIGGQNTTIMINGNVSNGGYMGQYYFDDGGAVINVTGILTNTGEFKVGGFTEAPDTFTVGALINNVSSSGFNAADVINGTLNVEGTLVLQSGELHIFQTGTLNWVNGGIGLTDLPADTTLDLEGAFNVVNAGVTSNGIANLTSVEGLMRFDNQQANTVTPVGGTLSISTTGELDPGYFYGATLTVNGNVDVAGVLQEGIGINITNDTMTITGTLKNEGSGTINIYGPYDVLNVGNLSNAGQLNLGFYWPANLNVTGSGTSSNSGTMTLGSGNLTVVGNFTNTGSITTQSGNLNSTISVAGTFTNATGATLSLEVAGGGVGDIATFGQLANGGNISGVSGTLIGVGTGTFSSGNGYQELANGILDEIISSSSSYGVITVGDGATLDGTLDIVFENGFVPSIGESFAFLNFAPGGLSGAFAHIQGLTFDGGLEEWTIGYDNADGQVILTAESTTTSGAPEPATFALFGGGLLLVGWLAVHSKH